MIDNLRTQIALLLVPLLGLALLTRPTAEEWPDAVERLRKKERNAAGSFAIAMKPVKAAWADVDERWPRLIELAWAKSGVGVSNYAEEKLCVTHKTCTFKENCGWPWIVYRAV